MQAVHTNSPPLIGIYHHAKQKMEIHCQFARNERCYGVSTVDNKIRIKSFLRRKNLLTSCNKIESPIAPAWIKTREEQEVYEAKVKPVEEVLKLGSNQTG
jgi:hypothetical protein